MGEAYNRVVSICLKMLASSWRSLLNLTLIKRDIRSASAIRATLLPLQSHIHSYMPTEFMSDFLGSAPRPVEASIKEKLTSSLQPQLLQVINESHMHAVPKNSETHFKVVIVSESFEGVKSIDRHRKINALLSAELEGGVHALSIVAKTPKQWTDSGENAGKSPPCRGGMGL